MAYLVPLAWPPGNCRQGCPLSRKQSSQPGVERFCFQKTGPIHGEVRQKMVMWDGKKRARASCATKHKLSKKKQCLLVANDLAVHTRDLYKTATRAAQNVLASEHGRKDTKLRSHLPLSKTKRPTQSANGSKGPCGLNFGQAFIGHIHHQHLHRSD